jgi:hypothetical protein
MESTNINGNSTPRKAGTPIKIQENTLIFEKELKPAIQSTFLWVRNKFVVKISDFRDRH